MNVGIPAAPGMPTFIAPDALSDAALDAMWNALPDAPKPVVKSSAKPAAGRAKLRQKFPARVFAAEIEAGVLPSAREVMRRMGCGMPKARAILAELAAMNNTETPADGHQPEDGNDNAD
jgi:hypothetical protein